MKSNGYRKNSGVDYGLIDVVNKISDAMSNNNLTLGVFINLYKAFDTVDHSILLSKLENYGINGCALLWFKSYLENRFQYVEIDSFQSNKMLIT